MDAGLSYAHRDPGLCHVCFATPCTGLHVRVPSPLSFVRTCSSRAILSFTFCFNDHIATLSLFVDTLGPQAFRSTTTLCTELEIAGSFRDFRLIIFYWMKDTFQKRCQGDIASAVHLSVTDQVPSLHTTHPIHPTTNPYPPRFPVYLYDPNLVICQRGSSDWHVVLSTTWSHPTEPCSPVYRHSNGIGMKETSARLANSDGPLFRIFLFLPGTTTSFLSVHKVAHSFLFPEKNSSLWHMQNSLAYIARITSCFASFSSTALFLYP
jgi:hypothetical protein